jgi:hypothetical protein
MLQIGHSGHPKGPVASVRDGVLVRATEPKDLDYLLGLVTDLLREPSRAPPRPGETPDEAQLRTLTGRLLSMPEPVPPGSTIPDLTAVQSLVAGVHEGREMGELASLAIGLAGALEAWRGGLGRKLAADGSSAVDSVGGAGAIEAILLLAMPGRQRNAVLTFSETRAALLIEPGSVLTRIVKCVKDTAVRTGRWLLALIPGVRTLTNPSARAGSTEFVDQIRDLTPSRYPFPRLDRLTRSERDQIRHPQVLLVLLHGLFATDRGMFDGLPDRLHQQSPADIFTRLVDGGDDLTVDDEQRRSLAKLLLDLRSGMEKLASHPIVAGLLRGVAAGAAPDAPTPARHEPRRLHREFVPAEAERRESIPASEAIRGPLINWAPKREPLQQFLQFLQASIGAVGFPHQTLDPIADNGDELARLLRRHVDPLSTRVVFLCHSRGGLVARWAAAKLRHEPAWRDSLTDIITFGTPHEGAERIAAYLLALNATGTAASIEPVLNYLQEYEPEGIFDLRPGGGATKTRPVSFQSRLRALEDAVGLPCVTTVGGAVDAAALANWRQSSMSAFASLKTGQGEHDLVVTTRSSLADSIGPEIQIKDRCDHFSYFKAPAGRQTLIHDAVVARLWSRVDFARAAEQFGKPPPPPPGPAASIRDSLGAAATLPALSG